MVAILTITLWIYDLVLSSFVLSSFEFHLIFMFPVTLLLQFKEEPLEASPKENGTLSTQSEHTHFVYQGHLQTH